MGCWWRGLPGVVLLTARVAGRGRCGCSGWLRRVVDRVLDVPVGNSGTLNKEILENRGTDTYTGGMGSYMSLAKAGMNGESGTCNDPGRTRQDALLQVRRSAMFADTRTHRAAPTGHTRVRSGNGLRCIGASRGRIAQQGRSCSEREKDSRISDRPAPATAPGALFGSRSRGSLCPGPDVHNRTPRASRDGGSLPDRDSPV